MEQIQFKRIIDQLRADDSAVRRVTIPEELIAQLTREQAEELVALFGSTTLMSLPAREQTFFTWLQSSDPSVWEDLWGGDEDPYLVSIGYLPEFLPKRRGFLICDLVDQQNFYFTEDSITAEEGKLFLDAALDIVHDNGRLAMEQAFVIEAWRAPIDLWRFAYTYEVPLDQVKKMVLWLISEGILLLPPTEEEEQPGERTDADQQTANGVDGE